MGYPRSQLMDPTVSGTYHCVSRCVRRAFLCGDDVFSGRNFDHRKQWIEDRLLFLAEVFSASVLAYAVMSNHVHVVVHMAPEQVDRWRDEEVAARWVRLCPVKVNGEVAPELCRRKVLALVGNEERLRELRARLGNLSWFMRCLAEPIAREANEEDGCTGRFWEGRYKCQILLDDQALLACMAYVDLNPVRGGIASDLRTSHHTSIHRKIELSDSAALSRPIAAVAGPSMAGFLPISEGEYIELVDWAGRQLRPDKRGAICHTAPRALQRVGDDAAWLSQVRGIEMRYWRAVGTLDALLEAAKAIGQRWLKGGRVLASI
ncbi:transposase [Pseudomarimonas arenosa]|uniref:Transposase n=1 Tax=Pseudomarimonas arenosa TaxID=2774145 RepID=A0AAW3ZV83_9GAMM|nr:transposase [Pseudomarimonas arenosa]MBD8527976.1 transposase [Pseudomarimonas arenosa]